MIDTVVIGHLEKAFQAGRRQDWSGMERELRAAVDWDEGCSLGWLALGLVRLDRGTLTEAYEDLSEFALVNPEPEAAEWVEVLLYILENLENVEGAAGLELEFEMEERFVSFLARAGVGIRQTFADLRGLSPLEAVHTPAGRVSLLRMLRNERFFGCLAVEHLERDLSHRG